MTSLPRHYFYGIIMFTFIIVGGVAMLGQFNEYNPTMQAGYSDYNSSYQKLDDVTRETGELKGKIEGSSQQNAGIFGVLDSLIQSTWSTLSLIWSSFSFMDDVWDANNKIFGVPLWVGTLIGALVTILFVFSIWSAIFQREI